MFSKAWKLFGADNPFDPGHRFETSWLLPPWILFGIRALLGLYAFVTIFFIFGWEDEHNDNKDARQSFSYFTNLYVMQFPAMCD
jgi:hypothetical protein